MYWTYHASPRNLGNVLVLHGYRDSHDSLEILIRYLVDLGFNVITCDLPGHGKSANGQDGYFESMKQLEDVAYALLLELWGKEKAPTFLVGYSLGAFIELLLLIQRRALRQRLIKGVVSISAPLDVTGTARIYFPGLASLLWIADLAAGAQAVPSFFVQKKHLDALMEPATGSWCYRGPVFIRVAYLFYEYTLLLQKNIQLLDKTPILAFQGTEDTTAGYHKARNLLGSLSNTVFHSIEGVEHNILSDLILTQQISGLMGEWMCTLATRR